MLSGGRVFVYLSIEHRHLELGLYRLEVLRAVHLTNAQHPFEQNLRAGVVPDRHQHAGEALQRRSHGQMVRAERFFANRQRALEERLRRRRDRPPAFAGSRGW